MEGTPGNAETAALFERIADLLEIRGENVFKVNAYRRAAENILETGRPLAEIRAAAPQDVQPPRPPMYRIKRP